LEVERKGDKKERERRGERRRWIGEGEMEVSEDGRSSEGCLGV
jgi:hypothetical protein